MKIRSLSKKSTFAILIGGAALTLVAWSPTPAGDNIIMSSGNIKLSEGVLEVRPGTVASNIYGAIPLPAVIVGDSNRTNQTGTSALAAVATPGQGIVVGTDNRFGTVLSGPGVRTFGVTIGESNRSSVRNTLVVGNTNEVSPNATTWGDSVRNSGIFGTGNNLTAPTGGCTSILLGGTANSVYADNALVTGSGNTVQGPSVTTKSYQSAAIGTSNLVAATNGWAIGKGNTVFGSNGVAIGTGTKAMNSESTALGRYNSTMASDDVLVIGNGTNDTSRSTAFRVTSDGGVILGRAQGDISMGIYGGN